MEYVSLLDFHLRSYCRVFMVSDIFILGFYSRWVEPKPGSLIIVREIADVNNIVEINGT